jgi:hypothetical protein
LNEISIRLSIGTLIAAGPIKNKKKEKLNTRPFFPKQKVPFVSIKFLLGAEESIADAPSPATWCSCRCRFWQYTDTDTQMGPLEPETPITSATLTLKIVQLVGVLKKKKKRDRQEQKNFCSFPSHVTAMINQNRPVMN